MTSISVIVVCLNSEKTISECLSSLRDQSVQPDEVIVVDGGSTDLTCELAEGYLSSLPLKILHDGNVSQDSNIGFRASTGDIIAFLDSDCIAPRYWLRVVKANISKGREAMGGPYIPAQNTDFAKVTYRLLGATAGKLTAQFGRLEDKPKEVKAVSHGNCAFSRSLFEKMGGFDERLIAVDDGDLCERIQASDTKIFFVPGMYVLHRWSGWEGLRPLAKVSYNWGKARTRASRVNPALFPTKTLLIYALVITSVFVLDLFLPVVLLMLVMIYLLSCLVWKSPDAGLSPVVFFIAYGVGLVRGLL